MSDFAPTQQEISNIIDPQDTTVVLVDGTNPAYKAVINSSGALLVTGSSGTFQVKDNSAAVLGTDLACIIAGYDGTNYQFINVDSNGRLNINIENSPIIHAQDTSHWTPASRNSILETSGPILRDTDGQLIIRGAVLNDEGSMRDDFIGSSLAANIVGTVTFTNGSPIITGVGSSFIQDLTKNRYVKLSTDSDADYALIANVLSDTEAELDEPYAGTGGTGTGVWSRWLPSTLTGGSIVVASSEVQLITNTTNGAQAKILRFGDYGPYSVLFSARISQRIINQECRVGFRDDSGNWQALVVFSGTDNTKVSLRTSFDSSDVEATTFSLPGGLTTASLIDYQLEVNAAKVTLTVNGIFVGEHKLHIPGPYFAMNLQCDLLNTAATASTTTAYINTLYFSNYDLVQVASYPKNDPISVRQVEDIHNICGVITTTTTTVDQVVLSYTVPTNKSFWILGYSINNGETAIRANPYKIGRNTVTTEPAGPGIVDGNIFRMGNMPQSSFREEDFSGMPRRMGNAGDVVKITVTPSGVTSTIWRASMDFILR